MPHCIFFCVVQFKFEFSEFEFVLNLFASFSKMQNQSPSFPWFSAKPTLILFLSRGPNSLLLFFFQPETFSPSAQLLTRPNPAPSSHSHRQEGPACHPRPRVGGGLLRRVRAPHALSRRGPHAKGLGPALYKRPLTP